LNLPLSTKKEKQATELENQKKDAIHKAKTENDYLFVNCWFPFDDRAYFFSCFNQPGSNTDQHYSY